MTELSLLQTLNYIALTSLNVNEFAAKNQGGGDDKDKYRRLSERDDP